MLTVTIPGEEYFDEVNNEFVQTKGITFKLEHSLVSISKWESKWHKPFLDSNNKTAEETLDYVKCMTITQNVPDEVYRSLPPSVVVQINDYIQDSMTATWFTEENGKKGGSGEVITSELIYYWMVALQIPMECQQWHLNRLLTLIRICNIKNQPPKKMKKKDILSRNAALNAARKKKLNTKG